MRKHVAEPWSLGEIYTDAELSAVYSDSRPDYIGKHIAIDSPCHGAHTMVVWKMKDDDISSPECEATAERIVACINACAGVPTEQLEEFAASLWSKK